MNNNFIKNVEYFILGSAQFGLNYGIKNTRGKIPKDEVFSILDQAQKSGVKTLDTASTYGNAHEIIGEYNKNTPSPFEIITKISNYNPLLTGQQIASWICELGVKSIRGLLVHDLNSWNYNKEFVFNLQDEKQKGNIAKIGFSIYFPEEIDQIIKNNIDFDIVQIPLSILDQRFLTKLDLLKEKNVEVHVRSIFLQGLLLMNIENIPNKFNSILPKLKKLNQIAADTGKTVYEMAIEFCLMTQGVDKVVLGIESLKDFQLNISTLNNIGKEKNNYSEFAISDTNIIIPSNWDKLSS